MDLKTEQKLVLAAQTDSESFGQLYDYYFPKVYSFVASKISDHHAAEDLVSDIFIKILENIKRYEWRGLPFGAWVFRIARNVLNDYYRDHYKKKTVDIEELHYIRDESLEAKPQKAAEKNELKDIVSEVLKNLKDIESEVIKLRFFSELNNKEIARALDLSETNVGVIIYRTLKKIKPDLELAKVKIQNLMLMLGALIPALMLISPLLLL